MVPTRDPRDSGHTLVKAWSEFAAAFAAARMFVWLISELHDIAPAYVEDLKQRLSYGIAAGETLQEDWPETGGPAMIRTYDRSDFIYIERQEAEELERQLFGARADSRDFAMVLSHLGLVALHSALEAFVKSGARWDGKGPLPQYVSTILRRVALADADWENLQDLDATRHLIVHARGVVDSKYVGRVPSTPYHAGDFRVLNPYESNVFANTTWRVAAAIHRMLRDG